MIHNVDHQTSLQPSRWPHNSDQQLGAKEIQLTKGGESSGLTENAGADVAMQVQPSGWHVDQGRAVVDEKMPGCFESKNALCR